MNKKSFKIALLGQPNSGKSTLFNALTGFHQHVGNWPGKTVEKCEGLFIHDDASYVVADLPGSYGLTANSEEEVVTREYIENEKLDLIIILADASQLERSLYMFSDYVGIRIPVLLVINMIDVAYELGINIKIEDIQKKLNVPVIGFNASDSSGYDYFYSTLEKALENPRVLSADSLKSAYEECSNQVAIKISEILAKYDFNRYNSLWIATKFIENDQLVMAEVSKIASSEDLEKAEELKGGNDSNARLMIGESKYFWISNLIRGCISKRNDNITLRKFDKVATHRIKGKILAIAIMLVVLILCMALAMPGITLGFGLQGFLSPIVSDSLSYIGVGNIFISFINKVIIGGVGLTICMTSFVFAIVFVFGLLEDVGYMARLSYIFDSTMSRLGLHGKAVMPLFSGLACSAGAVCGTRVIDTQGQRLFTMMLLWGIPCGAKLSVVLFMATTFFGSVAPLIVLIFFALILGSFYLSSKTLGKKLLPENERVGIIMELPPYHKPHWKALCKSVIRNVWNVFCKAVKIIVMISALFWILSYSADENVTHTILYKIGNFIEPVTSLFGMRWQLFISYLGGVFSKEASLGIMNTLFVGAGESFSLLTRTGVSENLGEALRASVTKPEALSFLFASMFNIPCVIAIGTTYREMHSARWVVAIIGYYFAISLVLAFIAYHIGLLIF